MSLPTLGIKAAARGEEEARERSGQVKDPPIRRDAKADRELDTTPQTSRSEWWIVAGLLLVAGVVRIYFTTYERVVWGDEPYYLWLGQSLWSGEGYSFFGYSGAHFPPLFPALAGGLALITRDLQQASDLLYVLCGALLVLPIYAITRRIYGPAAALAAGLITALYPALTTGLLAWGTMTEPLYLLLLALAVMALIDGMETGRWRSYVLLALSLGLAYLTRTEAVVFALVALPLLAITRLARGDRWTVTLGRVVAAAAIFLLVAAPYLVYIQNQTGRWSLSGAAGMAFVSMEGLASDNPAAFDAATWGLDPASDEVYLFAPASESEGLATALAADPLALLRRLRANLQDTVRLLFSARLVLAPLVVLIALGLFGRPWDRRSLRGHLALLASTAPALSYLPFFIQDRYLAGLLIPALVWMGGGLAFLGQWLAASWTSLRTRPLSARQVTILELLPLVLLALFLAWQSARLWDVMQRTKSFQPGHLEAARALRDLGAGPDDVVMSRYPAIAFHAGTGWSPTPAAQWPVVAAYSQEHHADFLAVDGWEAQLRPQLSFLLIPSQAPAGLRYLDTIERGPDPVVIYAFE